MKKIFISILTFGLCFSFLSCANELNNQIPEAGVNLAEYMGADYNETSRKPIVSKTISGSLFSALSEDIYYFETESTNNLFDLRWSANNGTISVSLSKYNDFRSCLNDFNENKSGRGSVKIKGKTRVFIKITPSIGSDYPLQYLFSISGHANSININKYNR